MFGKSKKPKPARQVQKLRQISYEITPTNFLVLPPAEKAKILTRFTDMMNTSEKKLRLSIIHRNIRTDITGIEQNYVSKSVYMTSKQDMGASLFSNGFRAMRLDEPIDFPVRQEKRTHLEMADGTCQKAYTIYDFSKTIDAAWIHTLYSLCPIVHIDIKKISPGKAKRLLISYANTCEQ